MNSESRSKPPNFRPPKISLLYCGAWSFVSHRLYLWGMEGWEWGTALSLVGAGIALGQVIKAVNDQEKVNVDKRIKNKFASQKHQKGKSHWATEDEVENCKFLSDKQGVFLGTQTTGTKTSRDVFYDSDASISIIAPPGEGKTTSIVIPTLLANPYQNLCINDPKGECFAITRAALKAKGYTVLVLSPFADALSDRLGIPVTDVGLDIFSSFHAEMPLNSIRPELMKIMKWVVPDTPNMDPKDRFFIDDARSLGAFFALTSLLHQEKPTLPSMRKQLMQGMHNLSDVFIEAEESDFLGGIYAELAQSLNGVLQQASQQFAGGFGVLRQHIDAYDEFSLLGRHTAGQGIDPRVLKHPTKKTAVFLVSGLEMMEAMAPTTALSLTYLFNSIAADTQSGYCTALIDECGSLSGLSGLPSALEYYRGAHLRCIMIWQDLAGQAERNFGPVAVKQILAASKLKVGMGLQEPTALSMFSKACGQQSVEEMSLNDGAGFDSLMPHVTHSTKHTGIPLISDEAVRTMSDLKILVVGGNLQPLLLNKLPYWQRAEWSQIASPSPFRGE